MSSARAFHRICLLDDFPRPPNAMSTPSSFLSRMAPLSRRDALLICTVPLNLAALSPNSHARERRVRKSIAIEEYDTSSEGLKYYDVVEGKGPIAERGALVKFHYRATWQSGQVGNYKMQSMMKPYEFKVGSPPGKERKREFIDNANGLYSAQAAPKPPPAMYTITEGMRVGGRRTVIVPPGLGYGDKGINEIPPGATFELNLELLEVMQTT